MNTKREILSYIENVSVVIWGILLFAFPLVFSTTTTDAFTLPKQILIAGAVVLSAIVFGVRMIIEGRVRIRTTPFDLPVFLFTIAVLLSAIFAVNRYDALVAFTPLLFVVLAYYAIVNLTKTKRSLLLLIGAMVAGGSVSGVLAILSFFKVLYSAFCLYQNATV